MLREAWGKLRGLLISKELDAWIVDERGNPKLVEAEYWRGDLSTLDQQHGSIRDYGFIKGNARVVFLTGDLDKKLPWLLDKEEQAEADRIANTAGGSKAAQTSPGDNAAVDHKSAKANTLGRPTKPGIDEFWIEAARLAHSSEQGAAGQTQEAFIEAMRKWVEANQLVGERYAPDTIESKIKRLWRALKLGR